MVINSDTNKDGQIRQLHICIHSLSLSLARCCVTADVLVIREKVGISFARLIPEVSSREESKEKEGKATEYRNDISELEVCTVADFFYFCPTSGGTGDAGNGKIGRERRNKTTRG